MKRTIQVLTLLISASTALLQAQSPRELRLEFAGSNVSTTLDLVGDGTSTAQDSYATGKGFMQFTLRTVDQIAATPLGPNTARCPGTYDFPYLTGVAVLTFQDGSQVTGNLTEGGYACYDFATNKGTYRQQFTIITGSGRFAGASGAVVLKGGFSALPARVKGSAIAFVFDGVATLTLSR